jgi:transposase
MDQTSQNVIYLQGPKCSIAIPKSDKLAIKLAMLFEGQCYIGPVKAAAKYQYSKQRYYQLLHAFEKNGSEALVTQNTGPKRNYVRDENVTAEIIRYRVLDPDSSAEVIAQKMNQAGRRISKRSVQRTIADFGLQKKTLPVLRQRRKAD